MNYQYWYSCGAALACVGLALVLGGADRFRMASKTAPCCPENSLPALAGIAGRGRTVTVPGRDADEPMRLYVAASDNASPAPPLGPATRRLVVVATDVYGLDAGRHRVFADALAGALGPGTAVIVPDLFRRNPALQPWGLFGDTFLAKLFAAPAMLYRLKWSYNAAQTVDRDLERFLFPWLLRRGVDLEGVGVSMVGFCYGGWVVAKTLAQPGLRPWMRSGVGIHPSLNVEAYFHGGTELSMAEAVGDTPLLLLPAGNDSSELKPGGAAVRAMAAARGDQVDVTQISVPFPAMKHGWVTRGDPAADPDVARDQAKALDLAAAFIAQHHPMAQSRLD